jgi:AraC-like DNA-binding protein
MGKDVLLAKRFRGIARLRDPEAAFTLTNDEVAVLIQRGVSGLARYFKVSPRTLRRLCAKKGISLREFRALLIVAAARTLLHSGLPVKDVARRLGFSSSQTFARFLRRECGATASRLHSEADYSISKSG